MDLNYYAAIYITIVFIFSDLSRNQISMLEPSDFANFTSLRKLDLAENSMEEIHPKTFGEIHSLEKLKLSFNLIDHIYQGAFDGMPNLRQLYVLMILFYFLKDPVHLLIQ